MVELTHLLGTHVCRLWCFQLNKLPPPDQQSCLSDAETTRAKKFVFERDQRRYIAAHVQLRALLASITGQPSNTVRFTEGAFGKPALVGGGYAFNLSHSGDWAAAVTSSQGHLGVDIELLQQMPDAIALAGENFTAVELQSLQETPQGTERDLAFLRGWTRKEACLKAIGTGLSLPANQIHTGLTADIASVQTLWQGDAVDLTVESFQYGEVFTGAVARVVTPQFSPP